LILPAALVEQLMFASGVASLVPAANPPLDMAGRALVALAAAGIGAVSGLALAHLLAAGRGGAPQASCPEMPVPRPLSAREELGGALNWTGPELSGTLPEPADASLRNAGLVELVERLRIVVEHRRARPATFGHAANAGAAIGDIDSALRAALARLRQLREAA
jgi:hypothetical protein